MKQSPLKRTPFKKRKPISWLSRKRTPLRKRSKINSPKVSFLGKLPPKRTKGLNPMSDNAKQEFRIWSKIKKERIEKLREKFGYVPCEYCKKAITSITEGHHNNHRRRENNFDNCRILHPFCNRISVEDNNVKDVPSLL